MRAHGSRSAQKYELLQKSFNRSGVRRLLRRGGVKRFSPQITEEIREISKTLIELILKDTLVYTEHARHKTVSCSDVMAGLLRVHERGSEGMILPLLYTGCGLRHQSGPYVQRKASDGGKSRGGAADEP